MFLVRSNHWFIRPVLVFSIVGWAAAFAIVDFALAESPAQIEANQEVKKPSVPSSSQAAAPFSDLNMPAEQTSPGDDSGASWDSYLEFGDADGVANDVTSGIRVEDIVEPPSQYRYAAFGKQDPFIPPMLTQERSSNAEIPIVSVLQRHSLESLRIVGLWELPSGERKALVMTPNEEGIVSRVGDLIGSRGGKIIQITAAGIKVREFSISPDGTRQFEDADLYLGVDDGSNNGQKTAKPVLDLAPVASALPATDQKAGTEVKTIEQRSGEEKGEQALPEKAEPGTSNVPLNDTVTKVEAPSEPADNSKEGSGTSRFNSNF